MTQRSPLASRKCVDASEKPARNAPASLEKPAHSPAAANAVPHATAKIICITMVIAFVGGRPGMISAATGAMALLMITLVKEHGLQYLLAATRLTGVIQIIAGYLKLGSLMRFVSRSVVTGFVNALAILIFMAQLPELNPATPGVTWHVYALTAGGLAIIYLFPYVTKAVSGWQHHHQCYPSGQRAGTIAALIRRSFIRAAPRT